MENIVLPRKFKNSENIVIKYVVIVHRGVRQEMNFTHLSDDGVTLDVDRDVFSENIERKRRPEQISKNGRFRSNREGWNLWNREMGVDEE